MLCRFLLRIAYALSVCCLSAQSAVAMTQAPEGAYLVDGSGRGSFKKIQAAVDKLAESCSGHQTIFIAAGFYKERVNIPQLQCSLSIYGASSNPSFEDNQVTISASTGKTGGKSDEGTGTLRIRATQVSIYNINVENTVGEAGAQALALSSEPKTDGKHAFYGCSFKGFQDTVLANARYGYYSHCHVVGTTDFIFSQTTSSWFEQCDIESTGTLIKKAHITASGREVSDSRAGIALSRCTIHGACANSTYLGRPWKKYAWTLVQECSLDTSIIAEGWDIWEASDSHTDEAYLAEYENCGPGTKGPRAKFAKTASAAAKITDLLDDVSWIDPSYLSGNGGGPCGT